MLRVFTIITLIILSSVGVVLLLSVMLNNRENSIKNNFDRVFHPNKVKLTGALDLKYNTFQLAGISTNNIYLRNPTALALIIKANHQLTDTAHLRIRFNNEYQYRSLSLSVVPPNFYLMDGVAPLTLKGNLSDLIAKPLMKDTFYFVDYKPISPTSFILRSYSPLYGKYILAKKRTDTLLEEFAPDLLQTQIEGNFSVDGMLHYDKETARIIYVYYYRNQYISIDSSLNLKYRGNTIDTVSQANIKVVALDNDEITMAAPPLIVNKDSFVSGNLLFIQSGLIADNEDRELYNQNAVIDVYSLENKTYLFSFYIPDFKRNKMRDFKICKKTLAALYETHLLTFELDFDEMIEF